MKRVVFECALKTSPLHEALRRFIQKAVRSDPDPPVNKGDSGFADWVIVGIHCLREYLDHAYRQLMDVLQGMPTILEKFGLTADTLPDFTTVCARKQAIKMKVWRVLFRLSVDLHDHGEIQAIDALALSDERSAGITGNASDTTSRP